MITKFKTQLLASPAYRRLPWTFLIIFIYLLGRTLPISTVGFSTTYVTAVQANSLLENLATVSGGTFSNITLFSLGLSPYMTAMILWRFLTLFNRFKVLTTAQSHRGRMFLMFLVATIQAFGLTRTVIMTELPFFGQVDPTMFKVFTIMVMISGAFVLMWLGNMNALKGIGSSMIIIVTNMILNFLTNFFTFLGSRRFTALSLTQSLALLFLGVSALILFTVIIYRAEYRIKIRRINIVSSFAEDTFLPIKLNPAGGMPFMYGMTLMILPPMVISSLLSFFPENAQLIYLSSNVGLSQLPGIIIYIILLVILSIGFSYYNYDPTDMADNMRHNGDYIEHVKPGKETASYINYYLNRLIIIGTIIVVGIGGLPLLVRWSQNGQIGVSLLINNIYIVTTLLLAILEQVETLQSWKKYKNLI